MRNYEAMCVFRPEDEVFRTGVEQIREELKGFGGEIEREEDMGQRALAYPIKKIPQAHYYYYVVKMDPEQAHQTEKKLRMRDELLRFMMVRQDA